jgi:WD40 repeat protein
VEVCAPAGTGRRFNGLAFSPDGKLLAAGGRQKVVKVWRVADGKELLHIPAGTSEVVPLAFSPDGRFLAVGRKPVQVWELPADLLR